MKVLNNEKGIALFMVLVLSVIMLSITASVLYMVIEGTQSSGREKRFKTALEASMGGLDISYGLVASRGNTADLLADLAGRTPVITTPAACVPSAVAECVALDDYDATYTGITTKLRLPTSILKSDGTAGSCWSACDSTLPIDPDVPASYDMSFKLGQNLGSEHVYDIFVKIVDSTIGNTGASTGLVKTGVVLSNSGEITVPKISYLYTINVLSQAENNPMERARAEVLYGY